MAKHKNNSNDGFGAFLSTAFQATFGRAGTAIKRAFGGLGKPSAIRTKSSLTREKQRIGTKSFKGA